MASPSGQSATERAAIDSAAASPSRPPSRTSTPDSSTAVPSPPREKESLPSSSSAVAAKPNRNRLHSFPGLTVSASPRLAQGSRSWPKPTPTGFSASARAAKRTV